MQVSLLNGYISNDATILPHRTKLASSECIDFNPNYSQIIAGDMSDWTEDYLDSQTR